MKKKRIEKKITGLDLLHNYKSEKQGHRRTEFEGINLNRMVL
jgi:hypothetical protein